MRVVTDMIASVRPALLTIGLIITSAAYLFAQKSTSLVVRGSVTDVRVEGRLESFLLDPKNEFAGRRWERKDIYFSLSVQIQLCNQDEARLIVPYGRFYSDDRQKILFRDFPASDSKVAASATGKKSSYDDTEMLLKELEKPEPSAFYFASIEPGTCFEYRTRIPISSGFRVETRPSDKKWEPDLEFAMPEHPYFTIQNTRSFPDTLPITEAKARWRKLGRLLTTVDDNFFLETELITNKLLEVLPEKSKNPSN